jgi:hypothetical protein
LRQDPEAEKKLHLLRQGLESLSWDNADVELPPGLAKRTIAQVTLHAGEQPPGPVVRRLSLPGLLLRRADVLVAACLLILIGGIIVSWVSYARHQEGIVACHQDLKQIYEGLGVYKDRHGRLPSVHTIAEPPRDVAGLVIPQLISAGCLQDFVIHCPGAKPMRQSLTFDQALSLPDHEFASHVESLSPCFGYALGYRDENGTLHGPRFDISEFTLAVLLADSPPTNPLTGNSPNHGGYGQNVLFSNGKVQFCNDRFHSFNGDDLYLNKHDKVSAGLDSLDNVIGSSGARP